MKIYQNTEEKHIVKKLVFIKCDICGLGINPVVETKEGQKFNQFKADNKETRPEE